MWFNISVSSPHSIVFSVVMLKILLSVTVVKVLKQV